MAHNRVKIRVAEGGHSIPSTTIDRRYINGIINLFDVYIPVVDEAFIYDNSNYQHELIATAIDGRVVKIINTEKYNQLKQYYYEHK